MITWEAGAVAVVVSALALLYGNPSETSGVFVALGLVGIAAFFYGLQQIEISRRQVAVRRWYGAKREYDSNEIEVAVLIAQVHEYAVSRSTIEAAESYMSGAEDQWVRKSRFIKLAFRDGSCIWFLAWYRTRRRFVQVMQGIGVAVMPLAWHKDGHYG